MANKSKRISELPPLSPASLDTTFVVGISGSTTYKISINQLTSSLDTTFATDLVTATLSSSLDGKLSTSSFNQYTASAINGTISGSSQLTSSFDQRYIVSGSITQTTWDNIANKPNDIVSSSTQISDLGFVTGSYTTINSFNSLTQSFNSISQSFNVISGSVGTIDFSTLATTSSNTFNGNETISGSLFVSGTTEFGGNLVPKTARGATLGTSERPFREIYVSSGSINIASDIIGDPNTTLSNVGGNILVSAGGMRLVGDASFIAATGSFQYLSGSFTHIGSQFNQGNIITTGSLQVSGSTIMIGNNTMEGNTLLSGTFGITGSTSFSELGNTSLLTFSASVDNRLDTLETFSASADARYIEASETASMVVSSSIYTLNSSTASFALRSANVEVYVKNTTGFQINKGKVVRIVGATGDNPLINTASYSSEGNSANTLGITAENIATDSFGWVITEGTLLGVNTDGMVAGDLLYLGATGSFVNVGPTPPNHGVRLGEVLRVQSNNGSIYVRIDNGAELDELHNILDTSTTASYGDILMKSGSLWVNNSTFSASVNSRINNITTGSLVTTSSFNSYTASISTASLVTSISNLNSATSSYLTSLSGAISSSSQLTSSFDTRYAISASFVSSSNLSSIRTITSASYAALTPVSGTLYIIIG